MSDPSQDPTDPLQGQPTVTIQPYYLPDPQRYAIGQERQRHNQAMYSFGEYSIFCLMWNITDYQTGIVGRCHLCYTNYGKISEAYGQTSKRMCANCYGTTFEGGIKAFIVRPTMWSNNVDEIKPGARGTVITNQATIQSTSDFRMNTYDYVLRADGTRWQVKTPVIDSIESGFEISNDPRTMIGYNYANAVREDESSVAFLIPPTDRAELVELLDVQRPHYPVDYSQVEFIHAPLVPPQ